MSSKVGGIARAPVWGANPFLIIIIIIIIIIIVHLTSKKVSPKKLDHTDTLSSQDKLRQTN